MFNHRYAPSKTKFHLFFLLIFIGLLLLVVGQLPSARADEPTTAQDVVAQAWQLAQDSGRYAFDSQIHQTVYPQPSLTNAGRPPENQQIALAAQVDKVSETAEMTFWNGVQGLPEQGMTIRTENGRSQRRLGTGEWETLNDNTDFFAPNNDPLVFLQVATNIQDVGIDSRQLGEQTISYYRYTFDIDATEYSLIMRQRLEEHLAQYGRLPNNLAPETAEIYRNMTGTGQLWLDADGLPSRLTLDLQFPPQDNAGRTTATLTSNFHSYDRSRIAQASANLWDNPQSWWAFHQPSVVNGVQQTAVPLTTILLITALLMLVLPYHERKGFRTAVSLLIITSILTSPLLQGHQAQAFRDNLTTAQNNQQAEQAKAEEFANARAQLQQPNFDPHIPPSKQLPVNSKQLSVNGNPSSVNSNPITDYRLPITAPPLSTTTDTDGDGLTDTDEALWHTCAYLGAPDYCDGVVDSTDSDGDGLTDGLEVYNLTTHPVYWDSDGDSITDTLEINGFSYNGQMWYLNPNEQDSNKDGLIDSLECLVWTANDSYDPNAPCPDTDNDGTPDVWDDDNDNDGVLDATDISPFHVGSEVYTYDDPMTLQIDSLEPDLPVFVNVQLRPTNANHLDYIGTVLDWPSGDTEGQIQRRLDTTFATTTNTDLQATDSLAGNGDIRLIPIVEMTIPYSPGHYGNLPVLAPYQGISRTLGVPVEDWLDTSKLDPYGISVSDAADGSGDLIVSMPLTAVTDDIGGGRAAYAFQMLYWPQQTNAQNLVNWANPHEYRIQWLVQMITDECVDPDADPDTCTRQDTATIVHTYREEWTVTGLSIREDHAYDVAILYEDPALDSNPNFEDELWLVSWNLNNQFLRGRDCDTFSGGECQGDGQRDVTIANLDLKITEWSTGTDSIEVSTFNYNHHGFMTHVMMTETVNVLDTVFTPTGIATATLMFAAEETYRNSNLGVADDNAGALTFDLLDVPTFTSANLSWTPYRQSGGVWANDDAAQYMDRLVEQLSEEAFFLPEDGSTESLEDAEGKLIWAQLYFSALYNGLTSRVAVEDDPLFKAKDAYGDIPEDEYDFFWPPSTFSGASTIALAYLNVISTVLTAKVVKGTIWQQLSRGFSQQYPVNSLNRQFSGLQTATNVLFAATTITAVVGFTLFTIGFLSNNKNLQRIGEIILNATTVVLVTVAMFNYLAAFQLADSIGTFSTLSGAYSFSWDNNAIGPVGIILQLVVIWGGFLFSAQSAGILNNPNSIPFNRLLAFAIAQTIVALVFFIISVAIPILGNLIILAIILTEAILSFMGYTGAQAWLTEKIAESLYDVDFVIRNLNSSKRLEFNFVDMTLVDDAAGFTTAQFISYTMDVTNTLRYAGGHGPDAAKKATFRYYLQGTPTDQHEPLSLNDMNNEWSGAGHNKIELNTTAVLIDGAVSLSAVGAGQNQDLGGHLYLTESFVTPFVGCWLVFGLDTDCTTYGYDGSVHINVGEFAVFDILPATLSGFYNFMGNLNAQMDQDGDGLLYGTDPNPLKWDGDGDGLSDYYELANGLNPSQADGDGDGLSDSEELRRGLNPLRADADDDGLSDLAEWQGWQVVYDYDDMGNPLLTWAWPYPHHADADEDRFSDQEEYFYALHPRIPSSQDAILDTIQFSNSTVTEQGAPSLLLRFDEESGATSFLDNAAGELAFCSGDSCPVAGGNGRYNHALLFDGTNDYLRAPFVLDPGTTNFTAAAWFKLNNYTGFQSILQQQDSSGTGYAWLFIDPSGKVATNLGGVNLFGTQTAALNQWHHVAVNYDGTTVSLYLDGQLENSNNLVISANDGEMLIGVHKTLTQSFFNGSIDEVAVYDRALDQTAVANLAAAHYNVSDNIVAPDDTLEFQLTISNTNPIYPAQVVYYGELDNALKQTEPIGPNFQMFMDETAGTTTFAISGTASVATCNNGAGACPTAGVAGHTGTALYFDGDDELNADALIENFSGDGFTASFWIYPETDEVGQRHHAFFAILDSNGGNNASDFKEYISYDEQDNSCCGTDPNTMLPNTWYNITLVYDQLNDSKTVYVDGNFVIKYEKAVNMQAGDRFRLGGPEQADWGFDDSFQGRIDDLVFYDRALSPENVQTLLAGGTPEFPIFPDVDVYAVSPLTSAEITASFTIPSNQESGSYLYSQLAEAALNIPDLPTVVVNPVRRAHFDERITNSATHDFLQRYPSGSSISCNQNFCPTYVADFAGRAVEFNGTDTFMSETSPNLNGPWAMSVWVKPTHAGSSTRGIIGQRNGGSGFPSLFITSGDELGFAFYDGTGWNSDYTPGGTIPRNEWSQVAVTYDGAGNYQAYVNGTAVGDDALIEGIIPVVNNSIDIGRIGTGYQHFEGRIDNWTLYDVQLNDSEIAGLYSSDDLSLHLHYTLDEPPGNNTFVDNAGVYGDATCTNCPALGIRGAINRSAYFDGNLIQSLPIPDYWTNSNLEDYSIAVWMKAESGIVAENRGANNNFRMWTDRIDIDPDCNGCGAYDDAIIMLTPDPTEWTHVVFVFDGGVGATPAGAYVNGVHYANNPGGSPFTPPANQRFRIGQNLLGYVDDIRLYNRALDADDVARLYETTVPQLQYEFEEDGTAVTFTDQSNNGYDGTPVNAIPGLAGRIGNGLELNGASYVDVGAAANINGLTNMLTIMTWVRPDDISSDPQLLVGAGLENSTNGFSLGIMDDELWLSDGVSTVSSGSIDLISNNWQHVAATVGANGFVSFYLNGNRVGASGSVTIAANGDDNLYVGGRPLSGGAFGEFFSGQMDELYIYSRSMPAAEIQSNYNNQFRWFRKQFDTYLVVDNDVPTITLQTSDQYWPNSYIQLAVSTDDATSAIWSFEFGLQAPSESELTWQAAPSCADVAIGTVWCPYFDPTTMDGEGEYQLQFRAVDSVGNETISPVYSLYVDDSAPVVTSDDNGSWRSLSPHPDIELGWTVALAGTVSDPTLVGGVAGSGVYTPSVMVELINKAGRPLSTPQLATVSGTNWSLDYEILGKPHGRFYIRVTVEDEVGNSSTTSFDPNGLQPLVGEGELLLDARPPSVDGDSWLLPDHVISQVVTLSGAASELPIWGSTAARYHFDETDGATIYDHSGLDNHASCSNCPSHTAGLFGNALQFDGIDDTVTTPFLFNPITTTFSVAVWFNVDGATAGQAGRALMQQGSVGGPGRTLLYLDANNKLRSNLGIGNSGTFAAPTAITHDEWHHAVLTYDGDEAQIFVDGRLAITHTVIAENTQGGLFLGSSFGSSGFFTGLLDEAMVFDRVLSAEEVVGSVNRRQQWRERGGCVARAVQL